MSDVDLNEIDVLRCAYIINGCNDEFKDLLVFDSEMNQIKSINRNSHDQNITYSYWYDVTLDDGSVFDAEVFYDAHMSKLKTFYVYGEVIVFDD